MLQTLGSCSPCIGRVERSAAAAAYSLQGLRTETWQPQPKASFILTGNTDRLQIQLTQKSRPLWPGLTAGPAMPPSQMAVPPSNKAKFGAARNESQSKLEGPLEIGR